MKNVGLVISIIFVTIISKIADRVCDLRFSENPWIESLILGAITGLIVKLTPNLKR